MPRIVPALEPLGEIDVQLQRYVDSSRCQRPRAAYARDFPLFSQWGDARGRTAMPASTSARTRSKINEVSRFPCWPSRRLGCCWIDRVGAGPRALAIARSEVDEDLLVALSRSLYWPACPREPGAPTTGAHHGSSITSSAGPRAVAKPGRRRPAAGPVQMGSQLQNDCVRSKRYCYTTVCGAEVHAA